MTQPRKTMTLYAVRGGPHYQRSVWLCPERPRLMADGYLWSEGRNVTPFCYEGWLALTGIAIEPGYEAKLRVTITELEMELDADE